MTDKAGFCTTLIDVLAHESFGANAVVEDIRGFDGQSPGRAISTAALMQRKLNRNSGGW